MDKAVADVYDAGFAAEGVERPSPCGASDGSDLSEELFFGVVKSYNDRRGFGFLACAETAAHYGRDVYMPKAEATLAAAEAVAEDPEFAALQAAIAAFASARSASSLDKEKDRDRGLGTTPEKPLPAPRLAEEDLVSFRVRLSVEGYPQAACVRRLRKFVGIIQRRPSGDINGECGSLASDGTLEVHGLRDVLVHRSSCGQIRLEDGDEVTFCVPNACPCREDGAVTRAASPLEAKLVFLSKSIRSHGSVLGCFTLELPRTGVGEEALRPLMLDCHAFGDKLILAGLPQDLEEAELMRFFSKQGATSTIVAHARACSFASVSFPSVIEVARFLGRVAHAFADDKETRIARLLSLDPTVDVARLPALPAPSLTTGDEAGSLLVSWSPLVLAVAYTVELRPSGTGDPWSTVDASSRLGNSSKRFGSDCSSCKVLGLSKCVAYEARISYFTECGTRSEASEGSEVRVPSSPPQSAYNVAAPLGYNTPVDLNGGCLAQDAFAPVCPVNMAALPDFSQACLSHDDFRVIAQPGFRPTAESFGSCAQPAFAPSTYGQCVPSPPPPTLVQVNSGSMPVWPSWTVPPGIPGQFSDANGYNPWPGWRSASGLVVPPPATPELRPADSFGFSVSIQWPAVLQAAAYVVELREAGANNFERFARSAPEAKLGALVELRIGGLRPGPAPGRVYLAQVRTIGADGSESPPSLPGWSPPLPAHQQAQAQQQPPPQPPHLNQVQRPQQLQPPPQHPSLQHEEPQQLQQHYLGGASPCSLGHLPACNGHALSADAVPWPSCPATAPRQPNMPPGDANSMSLGPLLGSSPSPPTIAPPQTPNGNWAPPPWLRQPQAGGTAFGALGSDPPCAASAPGVALGTPSSTSGANPVTYSLGPPGGGLSSVPPVCTAAQVQNLAPGEALSWGAPGAPLPPPAGPPPARPPGPGPEGFQETGECLILD